MTIKFNVNNPGDGASCFGFIDLFDQQYFEKLESDHWQFNKPEYGKYGGYFSRYVLNDNISPELLVRESLACAKFYNLIAETYSGLPDSISELTATSATLRNAVSEYYELENPQDRYGDMLERKPYNSIIEQYQLKQSQLPDRIELLGQELKERIDIDNQYNPAENQENAIISFEIITPNFIKPDECQFVCNQIGQVSTQYEENKPTYSCDFECDSYEYELYMRFNAESNEKANQINETIKDTLKEKGFALNENEVIFNYLSNSNEYFIVIDFSE